MTEPDLAQRLETLETTVAFQDRTIEELNQAVAGQYREIERLKRELQRLGSVLAEVEQHPALAPGKEPPPPHY